MMWHFVNSSRCHQKENFQQVINGKDSSGVFWSGIVFETPFVQTRYLLRYFSYCITSTLIGSL